MLVRIDYTWKKGALHYCESKDGMDWSLRNTLAGITLPSPFLP